MKSNRFLIGVAGLVLLIATSQGCQDDEVILPVADRQLSARSVGCVTEWGQTLFLSDNFYIQKKNKPSQSLRNDYFIRIWNDGDSVYFDLFRQDVKDKIRKLVRDEGDALLFTPPVNSYSWSLAVDPCMQSGYELTFSIVVDDIVNGIFTYSVQGLCVPEYVPLGGLLAWYPFRGGANDLSGNGHHGSIQGPALTQDRFGCGSGAFLFTEPADVIIVPPSPMLNSSHITVSLWLQMTGVHGHPTRPPYGSILKKGNFDNAYNEVFALLASSSQVQFGVKTSSCSPGVGWTRFYSPATLLDNWHHLVLTYDGQHFKTYLDGSLISSQTSAGELVSCPGGGLAMGLEWAGGYSSIIGKLDDVGLWGRALTSQEVEVLYAGSAP